MLSSEFLNWDTETGALKVEARPAEALEPQCRDARLLKDA